MVIRSAVLAVLVLLTALSGVSVAQQAVTAYPAPWNQVGATATLAATGASSRVVLGWVATGQSAPPVVWVHNASATVDVYVVMGNVSVVATTAGVLVAAGGDALINLNKASYIAGITGGGAATLSIATGIGSPLAKGGGGGGGGGTATDITVGTTTVTSGTDKAILYDNAGVLGNLALGTGLTSTASAINLTQPQRDISGSGVAIVAADASKLVLLGAFTYTLAQAGTTGFETGYSTCLLNVGAGAATVNATTSTFLGLGGGTSLVLQVNDWACPTSNGTNYDTVGVASTGTGANVRASGPTLTGVPLAPTASAGTNTTQIATAAFVKTAVDNGLAGVNPAVATQAATTAAGDTSGLTYNNGAAGIGAFFTGSVNTAITIDGYTFTALGQRLLVKNDTQSPSGAFNGVYYVTQVQTGILPPILTRALDYDMPSDINNTGTVPVVNGTVNGGTSWLLTSSVTTVGTDPLTYVAFVQNPARVAITGGTIEGTTVGAATPASGKFSTLTAAGAVVGNGRIVSGTSDTPAAADCGGTIHFTSGSAITVTMPNSITTLQCTITFLQEGAGQITFAAAGGAAIHSRPGYTKTAGQWAAVDMILNTNAGGTSAVYSLAGDGA